MNPTYYEKLRDPRWQKKRLKIMERDNFTCLACGKDTGTLNVHHVHYAKGDPWLTPDRFLMTLCEPCHKERKTPETALKEEFAFMLTRLSVDQMADLFEQFQKLCPDGEQLDNGVKILSQLEYDYHTDTKWFIAASDEKLMEFWKFVTAPEYQPGEMFVP